MESPPLIRPHSSRHAADGPAPEPAQLGPVIHTWRFSALRWRLIQAAITWAGCALLLALIVLGKTGDFDFIERNLGFFAVVSTVLAAIPLIFLLFRRAQKIVLEVRPMGLVFSGSHHGVIPWADVTGLNREPGGLSPDGRTRHLWRCIVNTSRWHFHFGPGHLSGLRLYQILAEQTRPLVWERLRAALLAGNEFSLGALIVGPDGIRAPRTRPLGWRDIATIDLEGRYVVVRGKSELMDGAIRVLRHEVDFETVLEHLETTTFAFRFGTAAELTLPEMAAAPTPVATQEKLPAANVVRGADTVGATGTDGGP